MSYHVELPSTLADFDALKDDWQALCATLPENTGAFTSYPYLRSYLQFHQPARWTVVAIYNGDKSRLLGVFPLSLFNIEHEGVHYLACKPMATPYAAYHEFAVRSHERRQVMQVLQQILSSHLKCDVALLGPLHEASPLCGILQPDGVTQQLKVLINPGSLSQIETRGQTFDGYFGDKKSLTLPDARYQERRLRKNGALEIRIADHGGDLEAVILELCRRNDEHFPDKNYNRHHPQWQTYLASQTRQLTTQGLAEVSTLRLNGQLIASAVCLLLSGRRSLYLTAYDPAFGRHSPSKILLAHLIGKTFEERGVFCFGAGDYAYKRDWGQSVNDARTPVIYFNDRARVALDQHLVQERLGRLTGQH